VLLSFEGIDGCGKTTQINLLKERLEDEQHDVVVYREPGGTELSEQIRAMLLDGEDMHPVTEMLLFSAARSQLIAQRVQPDLEAGRIVILDRFYDSTTAYQGYGRDQIPLEQIQQLNHLASHQQVPDLTFYLKLELEEARRRTADHEKDRMEKADDAFYLRVIKGFDTLAKQEDRFVTIDATLPKPTVRLLIWDHVTEKLAARS
jgi:dTMP kinase